MGLHIRQSLSLVIILLSLVAAFCSGFALKMSTPAKRSILYDIPVSNNGAKCRLILYKKGIPQEQVAIVSPMDIGGLKGDEFLAMNPQGKMPVLQLSNGMAIPESDTICRYLISEYSDKGPSFQLENVQSNLISRFHDTYLSPLQGCLYKATPPFAHFGTRKDALLEFQRQLQIIDDMIPAKRDGIYLCGKEVSLADATLFPTMVFVQYMLPKFQVLGTDKPLPPNIDKWFHDVIQQDLDFRKVHDEIHGGIQAWEGRGRWDDIWLAGLRDEDPPTIFDKIIAGDIPCAKVMEDDKILAFKDNNPAAPAHVLVIPKDRMNLSRLQKSTPEHVEILGRLMIAAGEISRDKSLGFGDGARIVVNDGPDGGQEVPHLHVHILGGRQMTWPPG